jgi:putative transposase
MKYDPEKYRRRSIRLKGYDYGQAGAYFVTVCTQGRACLFGNVAEGQMRLNDAGRMIERWWFELNRKFTTIETDEFVVMPNHVHGIVVSPVGADLRVGPGSKGAHTAHQGTHVGVPLPTWVCPYPIHVLPIRAHTQMRPYRRLSNGLKR